MLARCFAVLRSEGFAGVVSYSDPVPRLDGQGRAAFRGHIGTIYQAHNAVFTGRSKPETKWLLPDGGVFESRAANKVTAGDTGRAYAERGLVHFGASPLEPGEDAAAWLAKWRQAICRPIKHAGNLRYLWSLNHRDRRYLPPGLPYPRFPARGLSALAARLSPAPTPARVAA